MIDFFKHRKHLFSIFMPLIAGSIFMIFACVNLTSSIWFDESYSAYLVKGSFADIWELTSHDVHPPFFYFCLKIWSSIFGTSDFNMRFMSVFFGVISIIIAFHLLKRWFGLKVAAISTMLMSISPMFIRYGQEMRMYTVLLSIILSATFILDLALSQKKRRYWVIYGILISLGMWTHYFSAFLWLSHLAYIIYDSGGIKRAIWNKDIFLAYIVAIVLYLPWLPFFFAQSANVQGGFWISEVTLNTPINYLAESTIYRESSELKSWLIMPVLILISIVLFFAKKVFKKSSPIERKKLKYLLFCAFLPPILLLFFSLPPLKPIFVNRYTTYSVVFLWLFVGVVLAIALFSKLAKTAHRIILVSAILLVSTLGIINVETRAPGGYIKNILSSIWQISEKNIPILPATDWNYYDGVFYSSDQYPVHFVGSWSQYQWGSLYPIKKYRYNLIENFSEFLSLHPKFWYIVNTPDHKEGEYPVDFKEYRVVNIITNEHHTALQFEKNK